MEMTIAEPIQTLEYLRDSGVFPFSTKEGVLYRAESIDVAIDTMRKYQKIAELYDYWRSGKCEYTISCMENIGKVLEDGKTD